MLGVFVTESVPSDTFDRTYFLYFPLFGFWWVIKYLKKSELLSSIRISLSLSTLP